MKDCQRQQLQNHLKTFALERFHSTSREKLLSTPESEILSPSSSVEPFFSCSNGHFRMVMTRLGGASPVPGTREPKEEQCL